MIKKITVALTCGAIFLSFVVANAATPNDDTNVYEPFVMDDSVTFSATIDENNVLTAYWSKYSHAEEFSFYALVRSQIKDNPVYPDEGQVYYSDNINVLSYADYNVPSGKSYYRVCHIAPPKRYCSKTVVIVDTGDEIPPDEPPVEDPIIESPFVDVPLDHWAMPCIERLVNGGVVEGNPDGTFRPNNPVNRAEFVKMIVLALYPELGDYAESTCFNDVNEGDWFGSVVCGAKSQNIVSGYDGNLFKPEEQMTRAEATSVLVNALKIQTSQHAYAFFDDVTVVWHIEYVNAAHMNDLVQGYQDATFRPDNNIARTEATQLICNALDADITPTTIETIQPVETGVPR